MKYIVTIESRDSEYIATAIDTECEVRGKSRPIFYERTGQSVESAMQSIGNALRCAEMTKTKEGTEALVAELCAKTSKA